MAGNLTTNVACNIELVGQYRTPNAIGTVGGFKVERLERVPVGRDAALVAEEAHRGRRLQLRLAAVLRRVVITLTGLKRGGKLTIRIVATHSTGAKVVSTRTWNGCTKGKPRVRAIPR